MCLSEFQIIQQYFNKKKTNSNIIKGIGDDAAVVDCSNHSKLVISIDTLISGVHFPEATAAYDIAYKSLAVNLSDLAAMGASPSWFTLALSVPNSDSKWLAEFSSGLFDLSESFNLDLIGGDTTMGTLSITIQIAGYLDDDAIMYRDGANVGDNIYVTGNIGDAGVGLKCVKKLSHKNISDTNYFISRLNQPTARIKLGRKIRHYASACIDISDGMLIDLRHITDLSHVGAQLKLESLPISTAMKNNFSEQEYISLALFSGDDYELCFCAAETHDNKIQSIASELDIAITKIGRITQNKNIQCHLNNTIYNSEKKGYEHFSNLK